MTETYEVSPDREATGQAPDWLWYSFRRSTPTGTTRRRLSSRKWCQGKPAIVGDRHRVLSPPTQSDAAPVAIESAWCGLSTTAVGVRSAVPRRRNERVSHEQETFYPVEASARENVKAVFQR